MPLCDRDSVTLKTHTKTDRSKVHRTKLCVVLYDRALMPVTFMCYKESIQKNASVSGVGLNSKDMSF